VVVVGVVRAEVVVWGVVVVKVAVEVVGWGSMVVGVVVVDVVLGLLLLLLASNSLRRSMSALVWSRFVLKYRIGTCYDT
jgi:hypothetical protein